MNNLIFLDLCVHLIITISVTVFYKIKWTIVLDTSSLLDKESRQPLHLLQGLKGTHLVVPRTVLRELNDTKSTWSLLFRRRAEIASSALDWIQECIVDTKWWIQLQSLSEETKATPQSNGSTSEDQVLECALLYRNRNISEKLVLLSNDVTLKIKAMAEVKSMNKIRCLIVELHLSSN